MNNKISHFLSLFVLLGAFSAPVAEASQVGTKQTQKLIASNPEKWDEFGEAVAVDGDTLAVGAWRANGETGAVYIFNKDASGRWVETQTLTASNAGKMDHFGESLALDGNTLVVGAIWEDDVAENAGAAYVYEFNGSAWVESKILRAANGGSEHRFGVAVDIDNDTIVVGAYGEDSNYEGVMNGTQISDDHSVYFSGAAYVFTKQGTDWIQQAYLKSSHTDKDHWFGHDVAVDGNYIVVGAPRDDASVVGRFTGASYVYKRTGTAWALQQQLIGTREGEDGYAGFFGHALDMSDGSIAVGAYRDNDEAGAVYVFDLVGEQWVQKQRLVGDNTDSRDEFGAHVAMDGDVIVVGATGEDGPAQTVNGDNSNGETGSNYWMPIHYRGAAYTFRREHGIWSQQDYLKSSDLASKDKFGQSVAVSDDTVVVGADQHSNSAEHDGAAYVFASKSADAGLQLSVNIANLAPNNTLTLKHGANEVEFGSNGEFPLSSAFVSGDTYAVQVKTQPENQICEAKNNAGSGLFADSDVVVALTCRAPKAGEIIRTQQSVKLLADNPEKWDEFGEAVAISEDGNTVVVGAWRANGETGAAYVFEKQQGKWQQIAILTSPNAKSMDHFGETVAISGDTIVVGAMWDDNQHSDKHADFGAAFVYRRINCGWQLQQTLRASNAGINDRFGKSVAVDGKTIVVGARLESSGYRGVMNGANAAFDDEKLHSGAAYVFELGSDGNWAQTAYLKASNADNNHQFGLSVAAEGDTVIVGAPSAGTVSTKTDDGRIYTKGSYDGAAYVFKKTSGKWAQTAHLLGKNPVGDGKTRFFGQAVDISSNTVVVGSPYDEDSKGAAYVFDLKNGAWSQVKRITAENSDSRDEFGDSVAIDGDMIVVGARYEDSPATSVNSDDRGNGDTGASYWMPIYYRGAAYTYRRTNGQWSEQDFLKSSDLASKDQFGQAVAISGRLIAVGADQHDSKAEDDGAVYLFELPGMPAPERVCSATQPPESGVIFKDSFEDE